MRSWENEITITAPAPVVFDYVADLTRHHEWTAQPFQIAQTSDGPLAVGSTFASVGKLMGEKKDTVTITELVPGRRLAFASVGHAGEWRSWFEVVDDGGAVRLKKGMATDKPAGLAKKLWPVVVLTLKGALLKDLKKIKARVEGAPTA